MSLVIPFGCGTTPSLATSVQAAGEGNYNVRGVLARTTRPGTWEGGSCCHCQLLSCGWLSRQLRKQRAPLAKFQSLLPLYVEPTASFKKTVDGLISEAKADVTERGFQQTFPGLAGRLRFRHRRGRVVALRAPASLSPRGCAAGRLGLWSLKSSSVSVLLGTG